ncbi:propionyl-CoA carboxylase alpha chain/3-methylcrotonyl-CoA carboxylase alpha subunit/geranyl-CoA carboxylase alpha subunit [Tangfeifania diversioriginum]|uniref:Propionyl-CoA carboxylase alpha chain/3-methylcrotonyl-CoA carboxylase alpha subunit/geranyl-CoA carboxylase alpha subunit n=1 Tax=Tangfeifania diversioriginum TaxID=1168035 RepID=A0A1M6J6A5_9BACT|nr:biotin carboxylase N-terminal domain-containing protein [Tangfeifania diversioriginum]SHJ42181.1 propionyl-CoA carboxylase alpha chain/3-methylcrotonyl-CoA carboxylase alpha subunit/geranyl-CoA carboxylase alpha subunit [Tangfeifania diversioriginum]
METIGKILIANRGEIAVRIIRTAQKLGLKTVAIFADDDRESLHVARADEAINLKGETLQETYLNQQKIIKIAKHTGAKFIHPGYGFLSEKADFAEKVEQAGLIFIGATPQQIRLMGEKIQANQFVKKLQIPVISSATGSENDILNSAKNFEYPVLVKASGGGGGKGMEIVYKAENLPSALKRAKNKALKYFANSDLLIEKYLPQTRHIEVQVVGDGKGNAIHCFERECSIQRQYQKLIEEAPANSISKKLKEKLYNAALKIARSINYRGAGTVEFLVDENENFYFLEMNTRLQVEHPVTEMITGVDLVEMQLKIAAGEKIPVSQKNLKVHGHSIEMRICAEDPASGFLPSTGKIAKIQIPEEVRWDSFLQPGTELSAAYDSLTGKLIVHEKTRDEAIKKAQKALSSLFLLGIVTTQELLAIAVNHPDFKSNSINTRWLEKNLKNKSFLRKDETSSVPLAAAYLLHHFQRPVHPISIWNESGYLRIFQSFEIFIDNKQHKINTLRANPNIEIQLNGTIKTISNIKFSGSKIDFSLNKKDITIFIFQNNKKSIIQYDGRYYSVRSNHVLEEVQLNKYRNEGTEIVTDKVIAGLFGKVIDILVKPGQILKKGEDVIIIESMKSEITIKSPASARVKNIQVSKGETVQDKKTLVEFEF